ncbi:MAG: pantoate kinase [Methanomassiliicoccales archaeon]
MRARAFSPGHITGFFMICDGHGLDSSGSRGAGACISLGATSEVEASSGTGRMEVLIDGQPSPAPVTRQALAYLIEDRTIDVRVETRLDLPCGQGFGMSAAGTLSAAMAMTELMGWEMEEAVTASHRAEVVHRSGLGDVAAIATGGVTIRRREGIPPHGLVERIPGDLELVLAVVGPEIHTSQVLGRDMRRRINSVGEECLCALDDSPTLSNLFRLSRDFARRTGLITPPVEGALEAIQGLGPGSMVMLGNSVFASGELDEIQEVLSQRGECHRSGVDWKGPRILDSP